MLREFEKSKKKKFQCFHFAEHCHDSAKHQKNIHFAG